jgi:hypothetical protein
MKNLAIEIMDGDDVESIWINSPHSTVFTLKPVLETLSSSVQWYVAKKGNEILCIWPVCLDENKRPYLPPFSYYVGPFWAKQASEAPAHRTLALRTAVYEGFVALFEKRFNRIEASLPIGIDDVRVFDWWNYHDTDKNRIKIYPRYTALLENLYPDAAVEANYRELRRREIRRTIKVGSYLIDDDVSFEEVLLLYEKTMERQGTNVQDEAKDAIRKLLFLVKEGFGNLTCIRNKIYDNELSYVALTLRAKKTSNLILNIASDKERDTGVPAFGIHHAIKRAITSGDTTFDFNGANSPLRGDDKHSYGARAALYFDIRLEGLSERDEIRAHRR